MKHFTLLFQKQKSIAPQIEFSDEGMGKGGTEFKRWFSEKERFGIYDRMETDYSSLQMANNLCRLIGEERSVERCLVGSFRLA